MLFLVWCVSAMCHESFELMHVSTLLFHHFAFASGVLFCARCSIFMWLASCSNGPFECCIKCAKGKTAIASRSHFYVLLMMMIECESVVQMRTLFLAYIAFEEILPFRSCCRFFPIESLHFSTLTSRSERTKFHWKPLFSTFFLLLRFLMFVGLVCVVKRGYVHVILILVAFVSVLVFPTFFLPLVCWLLILFPIFNALKSVEEIFLLILLLLVFFTLIHTLASLCFITIIHAQNIHQKTFFAA